jgi:hypothetical protein
MRANPVTGQHAVLEVAVIERPAGDPYINAGVWGHTDELVVDLDRRAALVENGLRVGQLVGAPPAELQELLLSKRSCASPHAMLIPLGRTVPIVLGPVLAHSAYEVLNGGEKAEVALDKARYCLDVTPSLTAEGHTKLTFAPKVEHGEAVLPFEASPDDATWTLRIERPSRKYPELGWDVTLAPNQYLVIGARADRPRSLGARAFVQENGPEPPQRLLVVRNSRPVNAGDNADGTLDDVLRNSQVAPLALQATVPAYRAKGH